MQYISVCDRVIKVDVEKEIGDEIKQEIKRNLTKLTEAIVKATDENRPDEIVLEGKDKYVAWYFELGNSDSFYVDLFELTEYFDLVEFDSNTGKLKVGYRIYENF